MKKKKIKNQIHFWKVLISKIKDKKKHKRAMNIN